MLLGTGVLFSGIVVVSLSKGGNAQVDSSTGINNERQRIYAIVIAVFIGFLNAIRTAHGKFMF